MLITGGWLDSSIEAPPSFLPQRHYCDITGLEAPYTDPATGLRYHDKSVYELIKGLVSTIFDYLFDRCLLMNVECERCKGLFEC